MLERIMFNKVREDNVGYCGLMLGRIMLDMVREDNVG